MGEWRLREAASEPSRRASRARKKKMADGVNTVYVDNLAKIGSESYKRLSF
jgi:hypothetical protein